MAKAKKPERRTRIIGATVLFDNATCSVPVNGKLWNVYHHASDGKLLFAPIGGCTKSEIVELPLASNDVVKIVKASKSRNFLITKENEMYLKALATVQNTVTKKDEKSKPFPKPAAAAKLENAPVFKSTKETATKPKDEKFGENPRSVENQTALPTSVKPVPIETNRPDALDIAITITRAVLDALEKINLGKK
jgi:hypothetical protein